MAITHDKPHARPDNLDPQKNGPFLDDIRREQEKAYRESRLKATAAPETDEEDDNNDGSE